MDVKSMPVMIYLKYNITGFPLTSIPRECLLAKRESERAPLTVLLTRTPIWELRNVGTCGVVEMAVWLK
jgi:hypothetical protein